MYSSKTYVISLLCCYYCCLLHWMDQCLQSQKDQWRTVWKNSQLQKDLSLWRDHHQRDLKKINISLTILLALFNLASEKWNFILLLSFCRKVTNLRQIWCFKNPWSVNNLNSMVQPLDKPTFSAHNKNYTVLLVQQNQVKTFFNSAPYKEAFL